MICPSLFSTIVEDPFEPLFKFAAEFGAGDQAAHIEDEKLLFFERIGNIALDDSLGQPFRDSGLSDARLSDEHRIIFGAAGQDLHRAADLFIASDDRIQFSFLRKRREIFTIFF